MGNCRFVTAQLCRRLHFLLKEIDKGLAQGGDAALFVDGKIKAAFEGQAMYTNGLEQTCRYIVGNGDL